ncbi:MAG TPA: ribonuclease H-like domain-containing protein [Bacteroidota bacterium]|nr:ribonuclease H-like domain-containing protein [Bacteroidota bacterium]
MTRIVFDIETLALPLESFDQASREYLFKFADSDEKIEETKRNLNLHALTAQVVAIALVNPDSNMGRVLFRSESKEEFTSSDGQIQFKSGSEAEILEEFWKIIPPYNQIVTFNGRGFDCPFLMVRSAVLGIQPTRNLVPYRYDADHHCDLLEQLTFYGTTRKFNLDFYCKSFGIESPKSHGITGLDIGRLIYEKKYKEVAEYCLGDARATAELFRRWSQFLDLGKNNS